MFGVGCVLVLVFGVRLTNGLQGFHVFFHIKVMEAGKRIVVHCHWYHRSGGEGSPQVEPRPHPLFEAVSLVPLRVFLFFLSSCFLAFRSVLLFQSAYGQRTASPDWIICGLFSSPLLQPSLLLSTGWPTVVLGQAQRV